MSNTMHDDDALNSEFRDQLEQALERQAEMRKRQIEIAAKLDALLEQTNAVLATHDAQLVEALDAQLVEALRDAVAEDRGSTK